MSDEVIRPESLLELCRQWQLAVWSYAVGRRIFVLHLVGAFYQNESDCFSGKMFFFRQTTECVRSGHFFYRTTKLMDRRAETHLS